MSETAGAADPFLLRRHAGVTRTDWRRISVGPNAVMNAIASQLSTDDIADVAAYFAALPGASAAAKSAFLPNLAKTGVAFPEGYQASFTKYHTINFPATGQVRYYFANKTALQAALDGKPLRAAEAAGMKWVRVPSRLPKAQKR